MIPAGPDVVVLTGFLGSGKTTLLRDFLAGEALADTAVIVNEVGEVGLDGALLREVGGDVAMTMLQNGCICCQAGSDLTMTVEAVLAAPRPDPDIPLRRIVVETSGLSKPGPVLRQLAPLARHRMRLAVVATYDAVRGAETATFEEAAAQWAGAHRIVATKLDAIGADSPGAAAEAAAALNPLAEIVARPDRAETVACAFAPPAQTAEILPALPDEAHTRAAAGPHPRIATFLVRQTGALGYDDLAGWLDNLAGALGERLLRLKGLVRVEESDRPILVQSVGTVFSAPRPFAALVPSGGPFLVVIARDAETAEIAAIPPSLPFRVSRGGFGTRPAGPVRPTRAEAVPPGATNRKG